MGYLSDHYRPERHYMRGPGPKWLEKHTVFSGPDTLPSERKPSKLIRGLGSMLRRRLHTEEASRFFRALVWRSLKNLDGNGHHRRQKSWLPIPARQQ